MPRESTDATDDSTAIPAETSAAARQTATGAAGHGSAAADSTDSVSHIPGTAPTERVPEPYRFGKDGVHSRHDGVDAPGPSSSKGSLALPAPALPAARRSPAITAVKASAARETELDPETADELTEETFRRDASTPAATAQRAPLIAASHATSTSAHMAAAPAASLVAPDLASPMLPQPRLYDDGGHLLNIPPMRGSHEILVHQNTVAESDGLSRIQDDGDLLRMRRAGLLVALPDSSAIGPDDRLPGNRRYARPWTVRFLEDLGRAHWKRFGEPVVVTSAARTVEFQRHLIRVNGNAAPPTGQVASPHLYGQAVDLGKHGMTVAEIAWMRAYLTPLVESGRIDVEEEFQQSCFHISVYRNYLGSTRRAPAGVTPAAPRLQQAQAPARHSRLPTALLATHLP